MTDYIRDVATSLASVGYVVAVPDVYHRIGRLLSVSYSEYNDVAQANRNAPLDSRRLMATQDDAESTKRSRRVARIPRQPPRVSG
jgi:dienelactone hydrolase